MLAIELSYNNHFKLMLSTTIATAISHKKVVLMGVGGSGGIGFLRGEIDFVPRTKNLHENLSKTDVVDGGLPESTYSK